MFMFIWSIGNRGRGRKGEKQKRKKERGICHKFLVFVGLSGSGKRKLKLHHSELRYSLNGPYISIM